MMQADGVSVSNSPDLKVAFSHNLSPQRVKRFASASNCAMCAQAGTGRREFPQWPFLCWMPS